MIDAAAAYLEVMDRVREVLVGLGDPGADLPVPACPGWTVQDVVAHHCGVVVDVVTGGLGELGGELELLDQWRDPVVAATRDALTDRQVRERRGRPLDEVLAEWDRAVGALVPLLRAEQSFPDGVPVLFGAVVVNDLVVHEGDLRYALGLGAPPPGAALSLALGGYGFSLDRRLRLLGLAPLALAYDDKERRFGGDGAVAATVRATRFDLVRALASRRTREQLLALSWSGDSEPYLDVLPEYGPTTTTSDP